MNPHPYLTISLFKNTLTRQMSTLAVENEKGFPVCNTQQCYLETRQSPGQQEPWSWCNMITVAEKAAPAVGYETS